jgi:dipeptidyl aminopeptidase/acylaminoacyl peptidase
MHICRTRFSKDIITEFVPPPNRSSKKVMIFCSGIPSVPAKDDVLEFWARKGFWTFFPRYRGTWESAGTFLTHSLEKDVLDVIDSLSKSFKDYWTDKRYKLDPKFIVIVGSSFGGPAAILASRDRRVNKSICISPVVDWIAENKTEPLEELYKILHDAYGPAYRLNKRNWIKLTKGNFYNPIRHLDELEGRKIMIFHARNDDIVKFKPVANFADQINCTLVALNKGGHLSSTMLTRYPHYGKVKRFLMSYK